MVCVELSMSGWWWDEYVWMECSARRDTQKPTRRIMKSFRRRNATVFGESFISFSQKKEGMLSLLSLDNMKM